MAEERWKQIDGFADYDVSDHGRVRSHHGRTTRVLKPWKTGPEGKRYLSVWLCGEEKTKAKVAHLVAEAFIGPRLPGFITNHIDGDKLNNHWRNLEWVTYGENNLHAYRTLGKVASPPRGEKCHTAVLTEDLARRLLAEMLSGKAPLALALEHGVSRSVVYNLRSGRAWKHLHQEVRT